MGFHLDTTGNVWLGSGSTGDTLSDAISAGPPNFYVTNAGSIVAQAGLIGGISINSGDIQANYAAGSTGFLIESDGDAFFNSVTVNNPIITLGTQSSGTPTSASGSAIKIGTSVMFEQSNKLKVTKPFVVLPDGSESAPSLTISGDYDELGFFVTNTTSEGGYSTFSASNGTDDIFAFNTLSDQFNIRGELQVAGNLAVNSGLKAGGVTGNSGEVLQSTGSGVQWANAGGSHADSDHTSFLTSIPAEYLTQTEGDTRYVQSSGHSHNNFVDHVDTSSGGSGGTDALTISNNGIRINFGTTGTRVAVGDHTHSGGSGVTSVSGSTSASADGQFFRTLAIGGTTLNFYESTRGDNLTIQGQRPTSNNTSSVGLSATQYNEVHARYGYFDFITGGNVSSQEVKTDITDLDLGIDFINSLEPKKYKYKPELKEDDGKYGFGFIAEEIETLLENEGQSNSKLHQDGHTDYPNYGRCAHELVCTCEDEECCPDPVRAFDAITQEWEYTPGCVKDAKCTMPCCTDVAGATINGINYVHATEEECEESYIDGRKFSSIIKEELIAPLVKAVQELSTQISDLTARVEILEG